MIVIIRVGCVNIDTSHPMGFADAMAKTARAQYVGVYNDSFRDKREVEGFIARYGLEKQCDTLQELAQICDIAFIQGCNWDDHLRCALPFIQQKIPVFIDKPIVGSLSDCEKLKEYVENGATILGASSVRYAFELQEFMAKPIKDRGEIIQVSIYCGVDEFNYGCHIVECLGYLMGKGAKTVQYMGKGSRDNNYTESSFVTYENGTSAIFTTLTGMWVPFDVTIVTTTGVYPMRLDAGRLYEALMEQVCNYVEKKDNLIASIDELIEAVKISLAMNASRAKNGAPIELSELTQDMPSFDGASFCKTYGALSGKMYAVEVD